MGSKQGQAAVFTVVLKPGEVRVRKRLAPASRPMADQRRKHPRHRPDHLADA